MQPFDSYRSANLPRRHNGYTTAYYPACVRCTNGRTAITKKRRFTAVTSVACSSRPVVRHDELSLKLAASAEPVLAQIRRQPPNRSVTRSQRLSCKRTNCAPSATGTMTTCGVNIDTAWCMRLATFGSATESSVPKAEIRWVFALPFYCANAMWILLPLTIGYVCIDAINNLYDSA